MRGPGFERRLAGGAQAAGATDPSLPSTGREMGRWMTDPSVHPNDLEAGDRRVVPIPRREWQAAQKGMAGNEQVV